MAARDRAQEHELAAWPRLGAAFGRRSMSDLRANVSDTFNWRSIVRRHPVATFCGAAAVGVLIAKATSR